MGVRSRLLVLIVVAAAGAGAVAQSGLASAALAHLGAGVLPAHAAARATVVDDTARAEADPAWPAPSGGVIPVPGADRDVAGPNAGAASRLPVAAAPLTGDLSGSMPAAAPDPVNGGGWLLPPDGLARLGLSIGPGCTGSACGTPGCGFLAPGCAWLDCSLLNPACGLGFPISLGGCGLLDPACGFGFGDVEGFDGCGCRDRWDHFRFVRHIDHFRFHLDRRSWRWHRH